MYEKEILTVVENKRNLFGSGKITISHLGMGENNLNMLVQVGRSKYNFRIMVREEESNVVNEFTSLQRIPQDFGPTTLFLDKSTKILPRVYSVLSYVEGKHVRRLSNRHLVVHAHKLRRFHHKKFSYCQMYFKKKTKGFDLHANFVRQMKNWEKSYVWLNDPELSAQYHIAERYLRKRKNIFTNLRRFTYIHHDLTLPNMVFHKGEFHYLDWEWCGIGDPARDLALFFLEGTALRPWMIALSPPRLALFLDAYGSSDPDLLARIRCWHVESCLTDQIYFLWKLRHWKTEKSVLAKEVYIQAVKTMQDYIYKLGE